MSSALLEVTDLSAAYATGSGAVLAVDRVSFTLEPGEFLGVVGESGCGKSTLLFAIAQLLSPPAGITGGSVVFNGRNLVGLTDRQLTSVRWKDLSVVMQSAMNAFNPVKTIGSQFRDAMRAHGERDGGKIHDRSREVMHLVGIDPVHLRSYPHQLSGGMRQRAMIAMALLFTPDLVIMDEPTSALDVVAQRSLMVQTKQLQRELGFAIVFVTHDMSLVRHFSDRLMVMYGGQLTELGPTDTVFERPSHPYTKGLMEAFPSIHGPKVPLAGIPGTPPDLSAPPPGCRFAPRCPLREAACEEGPIELYDLPGVRVRCRRHAEVRGPASEAQDPQPETQDPQSEVQGPQPEIQNPQSERRGPQSAREGATNV